MFPLLAVTRISTVHLEDIAALPLQQWLRERPPLTSYEQYLLFFNLRMKDI